HPRPRAGGRAGAAWDRQLAVGRVVDRPFDRDLAAVEEGRPDALPRLPDNEADAVALVAADACRVVPVVDVVVEGQHVADRVPCAIALVGDRVGRGMLDYADSPAMVSVVAAASVARACA